MSDAARPATPFAHAVALSLLAATIAVGVAVARELSLGRREVGAAADAAAHSEWSDAILHAGAAAEAVAPGSPWSERGLRQLEAIARAAELRGDDAIALRAYTAISAAAQATRGIGVGADPWRAVSRAGIARIDARASDRTGGRAAPTAALAAPAETLARAGVGPGPLGLLLLVGAALALAGGLGWLALSPARESHSRGGATARVALAFVAAGFAAYAAVLLMN